MNITLIGMPGAGKSVVGRVVAERLGLSYLDVDQVLEAKYGKPLQQILDEAGDEEFVRLEEEAVLGLGDIRDTLVSPGGSVVYSPAAMERLKSISTVVFLNVPLPDLRKRLVVDGRGVVKGRGFTLEQLFEERLPLYRRYADTEAMLEGVNTEHNAARVLAVLQK